MLLATNTDHELIRAEPRERANCPECGTPVTAKCGEYIVWHWAHTKLPGNCQNQGETEWHLGWKAWAHDHGCKVEHKLVEGFRADIVTPRGRVIELQSKAPDPDTVRAREDAYHGQLVWIYKVTETEPEQKIRWGKHLDNGGRGFRWKRGPKRLTACREPIVIDLTEDSPRLWRIGKLTLIDEYSEKYGTTNKRMIGWARPADQHALFHVARPAVKHHFCPKHHSHFCPCASPWLYANDSTGAAAWG